MNNDELRSRRDLLRSAAMLGAAGLLPAWLLGCGKKELSCNDPATLAADEVTLRKTLGYVDQSMEATKNCTNCALFKPTGGADACGGCTIFKGPIHPKGYCKSWAAKP